EGRAGGKRGEGEGSAKPLAPLQRGEGGARAAGGGGAKFGEAEMKFAGFWISVLAAWAAYCNASAQDTAAQEETRRANVIAQSPPDAAKVLFGRDVSPRAGPAQAIGAYERGCLSGAVALPADGPNWQVMRPSRNRAWRHPMLIALL